MARIIRRTIQAESIRLSSQGKNSMHAQSLQNCQRVVRSIVLCFYFLGMSVIEIGDGFIVHDPEPLVVCELGDVFIREGN